MISPGVSNGRWVSWRDTLMWALSQDLRFARAGQHLVIFVEDAEQVIIVDFLHARSDLPARLENLQDP